MVEVHISEYMVVLNSSDTVGFSNRSRIVTNSKILDSALVRFILVFAFELDVLVLEGGGGGGHIVASVKLPHILICVFFLAHIVNSLTFLVKIS